MRFARIRMLSKTCLVACLLARGSSLGQETGTTNKPFVGELIVVYTKPNYSLPFVIAMAKGYFLDEGVKILARKIGKHDSYRFSEVDIINGNNLDLIKPLGGAIRVMHPGYRKGVLQKALLVKKSARISEWNDLKGKSIVVAYTEDFPMLENELQRHGLKTSGNKARSVSISSWGERVIAYFPKAKKTHALYGLASTVLPLMRQYPDQFNVFWMDLEKMEGPQSPLVTCSYVKTSIWQTKKAAVRAYVRAIDRAIDFSRKESNSALSLLLQYFDDGTSWASDLEWFEYYKNTEPVDFRALSSKLGMNVGESMLDLSK